MIFAQFKIAAGALAADGNVDVSPNRRVQEPAAGLKACLRWETSCASDLPE
jgi:hypothetical protein